MANELLRELGMDPTDPGTAQALEDARELADLVACLVARRHSLGLRQQDVADRIGTKQSVVSDFERVGGNPRLSTLQRYARALGTCLDLSLEGYAGIESGWVSAGVDTSVLALWTEPDLVETFHASDGDFALAS